MSAHVLVADDEALILQSLRGVLLQEGFEVTAASCGEQAWQTFVATRPDVVLLDLVLGDISGLEVLRRIRQLRALSWRSAVVIAPSLRST